LKILDKVKRKGGAIKRKAPVKRLAAAKPKAASSKSSKAGGADDRSVLSSMGKSQGVDLNATADLN
jgi:hypothetical protein